MKNSEQLNELFSALSKAQGQIKGATKDAANPFFKSHYTTLDSCWDACRGPLTANGLTIVQTVQEDQGKMFLCTILGHSSGQYISSMMPLLLVKQDPQSLGSCISYMRRYSLCAIVGLTQTDDDGEKAMESHRHPPKPKEFTVFDFIGHLYSSVDGDLSKDFNADLIEAYLLDLAKEKKSSRGKIMDLAMNPQNTRRFIESFEEWVNKRG